MEVTHHPHKQALLYGVLFSFVANPFRFLLQFFANRGILKEPNKFYMYERGGSIPFFCRTKIDIASAKNANPSILVRRTTLILYRICLATIGFAFFMR